MALIELSDPLSEGGFAEKGFDVEPVEVTDNTKEAVAYLFKHNATVIGLPPGLSPADVLLNGLSLEKIEVPWWTPPECRSRWNVSSEAIHDRMLCAGGSENKRIAEGDSGGPLLINTTDGWRQIGVSVAAMDLGSGSVISAHVRLSSVRNWIYSYTGEEETVVPTKPPIILTHTFAGPLANATAETEITITNRTGDPCKASIRFHRGTEEAAAVRLNGEYLDGNRVETSIEGGAVRRVLLTADPGQDLAVGAVYVEQDSGCAAGALQVEGRYLITSQDGQIVEAFSVLPQSESDWMGDGECRTLQNAFGSQDDMGLAMVTAQPGEAAPPGARLTFEAYNWQGEFVGAPPALEVTGEQQALNPWEFSEPRLVKLCLDAAGDPAFRLSVIAIAAKTSSRSVQYSNGVLMRP